MIDILDYDAGNMLSLYRALDFLKINFKSIYEYKDLSSKVLIIPGVGNFASASSLLEKRGFMSLYKKDPKDRPFILGICLGMQLLFTDSTEGGFSKGLNLLNGNVIKIPNQIEDFSLPRTLIGWEEYCIKDNTEMEWLSIYEYNSFYHVHSYMCEPLNHSEIIASYPGKYSFIPNIVGSKEKRVLGFQFHPEKSGIKGLNFLNEAVRYALS